MKKVGIIKRLLCLCLVFLLSINSFAAIVSDNDGSAFITKAEFDALKASFQSQIDSYNQSIDSKIDGAIASYLAGIRLSTREDIKGINLGMLRFQSRDVNSTDETLFKNGNKALKITYKWLCGAYHQNNSQYAASMGWVDMTYTGSPAFFNGICYENNKWIYKGYKKYLVEKSQTLERIYNGNGALNTSGTNNAYYALVPEDNQSIALGYQYAGVNWDDFKGQKDIESKQFSTWLSNGINGTTKEINSWWQSRTKGELHGAGVAKAADLNFNIISHSYDYTDNPTADKLINVFSSSPKTCLYSLNVWDGECFHNSKSLNNAKWTNDLGIKIVSYNSWSVGNFGTTNLDVSTTTWTTDYPCFYNCALTSLVQCNFGEIYYPNQSSIYVSGSLTGQYINLKNNIPLVNIEKDGVLEIPLNFDTSASYKIWLDTVVADTFAAKRSTALTPDGYTLAADGSFTIPSNNVVLKVPVQQKTTVFLKWARATGIGDTELTLSDTYTLEVES